MKIYDGTTKRRWVARIGMNLIRAGGFVAKIHITKWNGTQKDMVGSWCEGKVALRPLIFKGLGPYNICA